MVKGGKRGREWKWEEGTCCGTVKKIKKKIIIFSVKRGCVVVKYSHSFPINLEFPRKRQEEILTRKEGIETGGVYPNRKWFLLMVDNAKEKKDQKKRRTERKESVFNLWMSKIKIGGVMRWEGKG